MTDGFTCEPWGEYDKQIVAARVLLKTLKKFIAHYPPGINPDLDETYGDAHAAIAQAEAAGIKVEG